MEKLLGLRVYVTLPTDWHDVGTRDEPQSLHVLAKNAHTQICIEERNTGEGMTVLLCPQVQLLTDGLRDAMDMLGCVIHQVREQSTEQIASS